MIFTTDEGDWCGVTAEPTWSLHFRPLLEITTKLSRSSLVSPTKVSLLVEKKRVGDSWFAARRDWLGKVAIMQLRCPIEAPSEGRRDKEKLLVFRPVAETSLF